MPLREGAPASDVTGAEEAVDKLGALVIVFEPEAEVAVALLDAELEADADSELESVADAESVLV